jgi:hypothetical protein
MKVIHSKAVKVTYAKRQCVIELDKPSLAHGGKKVVYISHMMIDNDRDRERIFVAFDNDTNTIITDFDEVESIEYTVEH